MNTSALRPGVPSARATLQFTGRLLTDAEPRCKPIDAQGHVQPVLCMDIELDGALRGRLHAEQAFDADKHEACHAAAKRLCAGTRVTVDVPTTGLQLVALHMEHVHVLAPTHVPEFALQP